MNKFEIKDRIDEIIYRAYNILAEVGYFFSFSKKKIIRKNIHFKNRHAGERCFILGTGPSLAQLDHMQIEKLQAEVSFGVNSLYKSKVGSSLIPRYYCLMDDNYWKGKSGTFAEVMEKYKPTPPVFITDLRAKEIVDALPLGMRTIYIYSKKYPVKKVSSALSGNIYALMNVVSYSIISAIHMGFSEIYLLGCDYNAFCNFGHGHCYDDAQEMSAADYNLSFYLRDYYITTEFHYLIAELAKKTGIKIINLTSTSLLDAYPRIPVSSIL